uniref:glycoside hydrolase family 11 protein n=1 Tax=Ruminococcus flavefaciens TaxID=1265 RepID=UPI0026F2E953
MLKNILKKLSAVTAMVCMMSCTAACSDSSKPEADSSAAPSAEPQVFTENITGTADGYDYELWKDEGDTTFTVDAKGGTFSCEWSNINNALFRRGKKYDCTQTYDQLGNISVDYGVEYEPVGNSYMCVYGWTRNPL